MHISKVKKSSKRYIKLLLTLPLFFSCFIPCLKYAPTTTNLKQNSIGNKASNLTSLKTSNLVFGGIENIYSIEKQVNTSFVKQRIVPDMFENLPDAFNLEQNLEILNLKNTWDDETIPFGMITFTISLKNVMTESGIGDLLIQDVTATGFNVNNITTELAYPNAYIYGYSEIAEILASDVENNFYLYREELIKVIYQSDQERAIFKNLIPGTKLTTTNFSIDKVSRPNNIRGSLDVTITLSEEICWKQGFKKSETFVITMSGFKIRNQTLFVDMHEVNFNSLNSTRADSFDEAELRLFVFEHKEDFVYNLPGDVTVLDFEIESESIDKNVYKGEITFNLYVKKVYDSQGLLSTNAIHKKFILSGFIKVSNKLTLPNYLAFNEMMPSYWRQMSTFTADVLDYNNVSQYRTMLRDWLSERYNLQLVMENMDINGAITRLSQNQNSVLIVDNGSGNSVRVIATFDGVTIENAIVVDNYEFELTLYTKPTPTINLNNSKDLSQNMLDKLAHDIPMFNEFKQTLADRIYKVIKSNIRYDFMPNVIVDKFNTLNQNIILEAIYDGIQVNLFGDDSISSAVFDPTYFLRLFNIKHLFKVTSFEWQSNIGINERVNITMYYVVIGVGSSVAAFVFLILAIVSIRKRRSDNYALSNEFIDPDIFTI